MIGENLGPTFSTLDIQGLSPRTYATATSESAKYTYQVVIGQSAFESVSVCADQY